MAGPPARRRPPARECAGRGAAQVEDPGLRSHRPRAGPYRLGVGGELPRQRHARRRQRRARPPRAAARLGGEQPDRAREGAEDPRGHPGRLQPRADRRQEGLARRPDRPRRCGRDRAGREAGRSDRAGAVHAGSNRCVAGADGRGVVRGDGAGGRRLPQLLRQEQLGLAGGDAGGPGEPADPDGARDDRAGRRPARPQRQLRAGRARRVHRAARHAEQRLLREPARHVHAVVEVGPGRGPLRGP